MLEDLGQNWDIQQILTLAISIKDTVETRKKSGWLLREPDSWKYAAFQNSDISLNSSTTIHSYQPQRILISMLN